MSLNASKGKGPQKGKGKGGEGTNGSRIGDNHAVITGDQMAVNMDTTAQSIIPGDNQEDVRCVVLLDITHHNVLDM